MTLDVPEKLRRLRTLMPEYRLDIYVVPSADPHQTEYVNDH